MIVLADNDIILKLAQCDLLDDLPVSIGQQWSEIFITDAAKYQLLPKKADKALSKCGNEKTLLRLTAFINKTQTLPEVKDIELLTSLGDIDGIDGGEKFLFAAAVEKDNPLVITGDRRALRAVLQYQDSFPSVFNSLKHSVITFESAILLVIRHFGFAIVKQKLLGSPKPDGILRMVLKSETNEAELV